MWRFAAIAIAAVLAAGCGGGGERPASSAPTPGGPCPEGTPFVRAADLIGPSPAGHEVLPADREALATFVGRLREGLGDRWRGYDAKVMARPGAAFGTVVLVVNSHERGDASGGGIVAAERDAGRQGEPIDIAGRPGRLNVAADGAHVAVAPAGDCALAMLVADEERMLRRAASAMGAGR
jgi:hypothetical protein